MADYRTELKSISMSNGEELTKEEILNMSMEDYREIEDDLPKLARLQILSIMFGKAHVEYSAAVLKQKAEGVKNLVDSS